jgi:anti-anti-sigma factor
MPGQQIPVPAQPTSVVSLPPQIDAANASRVRDKLVAAARSEARVIIADMTHTTFCALEGADCLRQAHRQAAAHGAELRLVVPSAAVRGALAIAAVEALVHSYPSLDEALAPHPDPLPPQSSAESQSPG